MISLLFKIVLLQSKIFKKQLPNITKYEVLIYYSSRRSRSITRPRQLAMALSKELTNHSLPEIGDAFGGRDHTTVLHGCRKIAELRELDKKINEDYKNMIRVLSN